jgi:hypothetical protein
MGKKDVPLPPGTTRAVGTDGEVLFDGQFVTIKHRWNAKAGRGESRYPIGAVTGVEVKPGFITSIFTLVVVGGVQRGDAKGNRKGDPLSVEGNVGAHRQGFIAMRDRILQAVADRDRPAPAPATPSPAPTPGLGDQLAQLAQLHAQGVLSDAEFAAAKARLIGQPAPQDQIPQRW